jgi:hypothetical protein
MHKFYHLKGGDIKAQKKNSSRAFKFAKKVIHTMGINYFLWYNKSNLKPLDFNGRKKI